MTSGLKIKSFKKVLIANRGEIAMRILRTLRLLHILPVCVFAENDRGGLWLKQAHEAFSLGSGTVTDTYLNISKIIDIARDSGVDAIHPGYGFLSENQLFAKACEDNNICFIGPNSSVLKLMGDKISAHNFVSALGIPVLDKIISSTDAIREMGIHFDYPLLVKAVAGGGGKGMRLVNAPHELTDVLESTTNEAFQYFSDERIFIERYLHAPRHIEVQILGDKFGKIIHLFERECSIQRRHQKIIEESPALVLSEELRKKITDSSVMIAEAAGYTGAGTIEYLLDESGAFYFLEMNPRIQVEHGITEMITGIDIVQEQVRIAEGYPLASLDNIPGGHAIEARIYAEDPEQAHIPSPGTLYYYKEPVMKGLRIDSAVSINSVIPPDYDPLIAKVIAHAEDRKTAIDLLDKGLGDFIITGVHHNISLIRTILKDPGFQKNEISTNLLNAKLDVFVNEITAQRTSNEPYDILAAATIFALFCNPEPGHDNLWKSIGYWRMIRRISYRINEIKWDVNYSRKGISELELFIQDKAMRVCEIEADEFHTQFKIGKSKHIFYRGPETDGLLEITNGALSFWIERCDRLKDFGNEIIVEDAIRGDHMIRSLFHGKVIRIHVSPNDYVNKGDNLMVMESMKLENNILAPCSGIVKEIAVQAGEQVHQHATLMLLRSVEEQNLLTQK